MFTPKIASLLRIILLVTCSSQYWLVKFVVDGHPGAVNTDLFLMVDLGGTNQQDVDSIANLMDHLYSGFTPKGVKLRILPLVMSTGLILRTWMPKESFVHLKNFLNNMFKKNVLWKWRTEHKDINYGNAFFNAEEMFRKDPELGVSKAVLVVAYMYETCAKEGCEPCAMKSRRRVDTSIIHADNVKKYGAKVITVGVGYNANASNLRCFASEPHMFIQYNDFLQLTQKAAAKKILDLLFEIRAPTSTPAVRSSIVTTLPATTKSRVSAHTNIPLVRNSIITILPTATKTAIAMFSNTKANAPASITVTGIQLTAHNTRSESFLAKTKSSPKGNTRE